MSFLNDIIEHEEKTVKKLTKLYIREWDTEVYIKPLTVAQMLVIAENVKDCTIVTACYCACDKDGNRLFKWDDIAEMKKREVSPFGKIIQASHLINEQTEDADKKLKKLLVIWNQKPSSGTGSRSKSKVAQ